MTGGWRRCPGRRVAALAAVSLLAAGWGSARSETEVPGLVISGDGPTAMTIVRVPGWSAAAAEGWVLQDSYDLQAWRDLEALAAEFRERRAPAAPARYFRVARKPLATPSEALAEARSRWEGQALTTYGFLYETSGEFGFLRQLMVVEDGKATETAVLFPDEPFFEQGATSIGRLFERIESAIEQDAVRIAVRYHPTLGYPESGFIDYDERIADEEWSFTVPRPPSSARAALEAARDAWRPPGEGDYRYRLRFHAARRHWDGLIEVRDGVAVALPGEQPLPDPGFVRSIAGFLELIDQAILDGSRLGVSYRPDGAPAFITLNWHFTFFDGAGFRYWISDLEPLP